MEFRDATGNTLRVGEIYEAIESGGTFYHITKISPTTVCADNLTRPNRTYQVQGAIELSRSLTPLSKDLLDSLIVGRAREIDWVKEKMAAGVSNK